MIQMNDHLLRQVICGQLLIVNEKCRKIFVRTIFACGYIEKKYKKKQEKAGISNKKLEKAKMLLNSRENSKSRNYIESILNVGLL